VLEGWSLNEIDLQKNVTLHFHAMTLQGTSVKSVSS